MKKNPFQIFFLIGEFETPKPEMTLPSISSSSAARLPADPMLLSLLASLLLLLKENKLAETELRNAMLPMPGRSKMLAPPVNPGARLFL
jgi:hypothetical protein